MNVASLDLCRELYELRDVVGLEDRFMVSNEGEIISKKSRTGVGITRKQWQDNLGYCYVTYIDWPIKKRKKIIVHRAVAQAFLLNPDNLPVVNHKDGNTSHNHVHNLEWVTIKGNVAHAIASGRMDLTQNRGSRHGMAKLNEEQVREIKAIHWSYSLDYMANHFGVSEQTIRDIRNGRRWKHVA